MKKIMNIVCGAAFILSTPVVHAEHPITHEKQLQDAFVAVLNPYIDEAIRTHLGYPKQYEMYDIQILDIKRPVEQHRHSFEVTVQVKTYNNVHIPPYTIETITFAIDPAKIKEVEYEHKGDKEQ